MGQPLLGASQGTAIEMISMPAAYGRIHVCGRRGGAGMSLNALFELNRNLLMAHDSTPMLTKNTKFWGLTAAQ
jgi:hypothetical protein